MAVTAMLFIITIALIAFTAWREYNYGRERRDLLNRIMSRDYGEYSTSSSAHTEPQKPRNFVAAGLERGREQLKQAKEGE